jgi:5-hydroxyisourate hydrolase
MSAITTRVLDVAAGKPATDMTVRLLHHNADAWGQIGNGSTDADGRVADLLVDQHELLAGRYRLVFETGDYFGSRDIDTFYPQVEVTFKVGAAREQYHVPLLLSPHGYSTHRGS